VSGGVVIESADVTYETNNKGVVLFDDGDAYYRSRNMINTSGSYANIAIESFSISDFRDSKHANIGRPSAIINQEEKQRFATLMYSEAYIPNTEINRINIVYPDVNFEEYNRNFGDIKLIIDKGDKITMFQEDRVSMVMIDRAVMYDAQGNANYLGTQSQVLSKQIPLDGKYGITDPREYIVGKEASYFADSQRGVFCRLYQGTIEEISGAGIAGYATEKLRAINAASTYAIGMFDGDNKSVIFYMSTHSEGIVFSESDQLWISRNTIYNPTFAAIVNNKTVFSDENGLWEINQSGNRNEKDGSIAGMGVSQFDSIIKFASNMEPGTLKNYLALDVDETHPTDIEITTEGINDNSQQRTTMITSDHVAREQAFHVPILRDINTPNETYPILNGDTMKGKHAIIQLSLTDATDRLKSWVLRYVGVIISKG